MRSWLYGIGWRRWVQSVFFVFGIAAALYFFWTTSHLVMAFQEEKTAHVFPTQVTEVGWNQPDNALSQDLSYLAPAAAFTTENSAYLQLAASTSTPDDEDQYQNPGTGENPAPPSNPSTPPAPAPAPAPVTASSSDEGAAPATSTPDSGSDSDSDSSTTSPDTIPLPAPSIVPAVSTDTVPTDDSDTASTSDATDTSATDDSGPEDPAVAALRAAVFQLENATSSAFDSPESGAATDTDDSLPPAPLEASSSDDTDSGTTTSMIGHVMPALATGVRAALSFALSKIFIVAYATSTAPSAGATSSLSSLSSTTSTTSTADTLAAATSAPASLEPSDDSQDSSADEPPDVPDCTVLGTACHTMEFSGFDVDGSLTDKPLKGVELNLSFAGIVGGLHSGGKLAVRYYHDGSWHSAGDIALAQEVSNGTNGSYFTDTLDGISSWSDLSDVKVVVEYDPGDGTEPVQLYVDAVWLDAIYTDQIQDVLSGNVADPTDAPSNVSFSYSSGNQPDNTLVTDDGAKISFPYLDSLSDTLMVRADQSSYQASGTSTVVYTSITDTGKATDSFQLFTSFPGGVGTVSDVSQYLEDVPVASSSAQVGDVTYFCGSGWQAASSSIGYSCPDNGQQYACSSLSPDGTDCLVPDVVESTATSTSYEGAWVSMGLASSTADSEVQQGLPPGYEESSMTQRSFSILPGQTLYFRETLSTPDTQSMRFVLSARGQDYFGDLDSLHLHSDTYLAAESKAKKAVARDSINDQLSEESDFGVDQLPSFQFRFKTQRSFFTQVADALLGRPDKYVVQSAELEHDSGEIEHLPVDIEYGADNEWTLQLEREGRDFRPGKYTVDLSMNEGGSIYNDAVDFYWGVLALNADKSSYEPGDTAHLTIAALDDQGDTMCDAQLALTVTDPSGNSSDVPVVSGGGCGENNVTELPDFVADYPVGAAGTYTLTLSRLDDSGNIVTSITDTIDVQSGAPYVIERSGPTRIYPASAYTMHLGVSAANGFTGKVEETVPEGFTVVNDDGATETRGDGVIYLTWDVSLDNADERDLSYTFKAPDVSPYIYLLGPATMTDDSDTVFTEPRTWKIASDAVAIATGVAWLASNETTNGTNLNSTTPYPLQWDISNDFDTTYYSYSTSTNPSELTVNVPGDYLVALTVPIDRTDATGDRTTLQAMVYVDGGKVNVGVGRAFIRTNATVNTSSAHLYVLLHNLNAGDYIEAYVENLSTATDVINVMGQASMYAEYVGTDQNVYFGLATTTEAGTNLNPTSTSTLLWYDDPIYGRSDSDYTHSDATAADSVTLGAAGSYLVYINVPVDGAVTSASPGGSVLLNGVLVPGGNMEQGYIANSTGSTDSSLQWSGVVTATTTNSKLTVGLIGNGVTTGALTVLNDQASIYIQELPASGIFSSSATTTTTGANWNPAATSTVLWTGDTIEDSNVYQHATTTAGSSVITVKEAGDYLLALNDSHIGAVNSSNQITAIIASTTVEGGVTQSHFIPNAASGDQSSGSLVYLLRNLAASSTISIGTVAEGAAGTITENTPALLTLWHKSAQSNWIEDTEWWYENANAQTPTTPWAGSLNQGDAISNGVAVLSGNVLRLRMGLTADVNTLAGADSFKLQYAAGSVCSLALSWSDVGAIGSAAIWQGYDNTGVTPGSALTTLLLNTSSTSETYEDQNPSAVTPNNVIAGTDGEWDWAIEDDGAPTGTNYCFRMVESSGQVLKDYDDYPQIITNATPDTPALTNPFDDALATSTLPAFDFSSSDDNSDDINYEIQISTDPTFATTLIDDNSLTNYSKFTDLANPADKAPFSSGQPIAYVPTTAITNGTTYWWRVRAIDPNGSDTYSSYSPAQSFTASTTAPVTTWYQATPIQFSEDTLFQVATTSGSGVQLAGSNTAGTLTSQPILFSDTNGANAWGSFSWTNTQTGGSIVYQVEYLTSTSSWALIPNSDLPGNAAGATSSPISLVGLNPNTYSEIQVMATFNKVTATPSLTSWTVSWSLANAQPNLIQLFDDDEVGTTTPSFTFDSTNPNGNPLGYQIQWTTDATFGTGLVTRTSGSTSTGFTDIASSTAVSPFVSGDTIQYTVQHADALASSTTFWWRVRARDPTGSGVYSQWSSPQSFTVNTTITQSTWYQTTSAQFDEGTLQRTGTVSGGVSATSTTGDIAIYRYAAGTDGMTTQVRNDDWDTTVYQDSIYTLSGTTSIVLQAGHYAVLYNQQFSPTAGTNRAEIQSNLNLGGVDLSAGWSQGVIRHNTGSNEAFTTGGAIIDVPTNSDPLMLQSFRTDTDTAVTVVRDGNVGGIQLIKLDDAWDYIRLSRRSTQTGPVSASWISVAYDRVDEDSGSAFGFSSGGSAVTLVNPGYYLVFANTYGSLKTNNETEVNQRITLNGYPIPGSFSTVYMRGNANTDGDYQGAATIGVIIDATTSNEILRVQLARGIGTATWTINGNQAGTYVDRTGLTIAALPNADFVLLNESTNDNMNPAALTAISWNTNLQVSTTSFSHSTSTNPTRVTVNQAGNYLMMGNLYAQPGTVAVTEYSQVWRENGGTPLQYGQTGGFNSTAAGNVGNWSAAIFPNIASANYFEMAAVAAGSTTTAIPSTEKGLEGLNIGTLSQADTNPKTIESPDIDFSNGSGPKWSSFSWDASVPTSTTLAMQVMYFNNASGTYQLVPDSALPGNAAGFTTSPVNIGNLNHVTYATLQTLATFTCGAGQCPTLSDWTVNWSPGINISGTAKAFDQATNLTSGTVDVAVNGVLQSKTGTISGGTWSIAGVNAFDGNVITVFINGATSSARAVAVTKYETSGDISGMELYQMHLTLGDGVDDPPLSDADISQYDNSVSGNSAVFDNVDAGNDLAVCASAPCSTARLLIMPGTTFEPAAAGGVTVTTGNIQIDGTFEPDGNTVYVNNSWKDDATFIAGASTVVFTATSTSETVNSSAATTSSTAFNNVTFGQTSGAATWTLASTLNASGTVAISFGTLSASTSAINLGGALSIGASGVFSKGSASTTFAGGGTNTWTDNSAGQDMGTVLVAGSSETVSLASNVKATNITIGSGNTLDASAGNYGITLLGNWTDNGSFTARSGTVTFAATSTGMTIAPGTSSFYNMTFNGSGGNWAFSTSTVTANNNFTIIAGTVTLAVGTTTVGGSFDGSGGTFIHNNGVLLFNGSGTDTIHAGTSPFYSLAFNGSSSWSFLDTNATTSRNIIITAGAVTLPSGTLSVGGSFLNNGGSFLPGNGTLRFTAASAQSVFLNGSSAHAMAFAGAGGSWAFVDTSAALSNTITFQAGTTTLPSATLSVGGSFINSGGAFLGNGGTVAFVATSTGNTVNPGTSAFSGLLFNSSSGGWTISGNATSTNNTTLTAASSLTLATSTNLAVLGVFTNSLSNSATAFGGTLFLDSGTSYTIDTKTAGGDTYGTLIIGPSANIRMWNSAGLTTVVNSTGSLYSMNNANTPGALDIWGAYARSSGSDYWDYATDFDGTALGSPRQVNVQIASSSSVSYTGGLLDLVGTTTATTTVANQGAGAYGISVNGATLNASYYQFNNLNTTGLSLAGSTTVSSLGNGLYTLAASGTAITVAASVINQNPALQFYNDGFATSTGVSAGTNVTEVGTPTSYWWFRSSYGAIQGEAFDNDPGGNPGYIRWDNSGFSLTISGHVYADHGTTPMGNPPCDGSTPVVTIVVNGGSTFTGSCAAGTGAYSISGVSFVGDVVLTAYLNTSAAHAVTVTKTPTANITNLDLYQNSLVVREEGITPTSIADLAQFDSSRNANIFFRASTSTNTLVMQPNTELYIGGGMTFVPGGTITLNSGGSGDARDGRLYLATSSTLTLSGSPADSIGGGLFVSPSATFTAASSTLTFTATTTGKVISSASAVSLYNVVFNGAGGGWSLGNAAGVATTTVNSLSMTAGTLSGTGDMIVTSGGLTGSGTIAMTGGTFLLDGTGTFGDGNPWQFGNLIFGNGVLTASSTNSSTATTTVSGILTIGANDTLNAGNAPWVLSGGGTPFVINGTFNVMASPFSYTSGSATTIATPPAGYSYANLTLAPSSAGSPTYTLQSGIFSGNNLTIGDGTHPVSVTADTNDPTIALSGNMLIAAGSTFIASNIITLNEGGSWTNNGTFTSSGATVLFNAGATGNIITPGSSSFANITFNSSSGGWTINGNATSTGNTTITAASSFTLASSTSLAVLGTFTNSVGGAATNFSGSTLFLDSGTSYSLDTKANTGETYGTLLIGPSTNIRMWNSSAATTTVSSTGSLYSQNHAGVSGALDIWGAYSRSSGADYWDYATDFDGTALGSPRQVNVQIASSSSISFSGTALLDIVGIASASTTIANQGAGAYTFAVSGGTLNAQYYQIRNTDQNGLNISGAPTVSSLSNGDFQLVASGTMITVAASVINANPLAVFKYDRFATSTGVSSGTNVTEVGNPSSSWKFNLGYGSLYGEAYDNDPGGDPGYIVWDNSNALITVSGNVYSDEGVTVSKACDNSSPVVKLVDQGTTAYTTSCNSSTGAYSISGVAFNPGDTLTLYLATSTRHAANVTVNPASNITSMNLYENRVIVRTENSVPITIANMSVYDSHEDANIPFTTSTSSPNTLTLPPNTKLIVWTGKTFAPSGNITLLSSGSSTAAVYDGSMEVQANATFSDSGTSTVSVGGNLIFDSGASLVAASSTFTLTATTTGKTVTPPNVSSFYNMTFNGTGGNWAFSASATTTNNFTITAGTVTLPTATLAIGANFSNNGTFMPNNGTVLLDSTAAGNTITASSSPFYNLTASGAGGTWSFVGANATTSNNFTIAAGTVTLPSSTFAVGGSFINSGTFGSGSDTVTMTAAAAGKSIQESGSDFYNLAFTGGGGGWTFLDTNAVTMGNLSIATGTVALPSGTLSISGSFTNTGGAFNNASGTVAFVATSTGLTVSPGASSFYNLLFNSSSGGWTLGGNATSTNNTTLTAASSLTLATSTNLAVLGAFTNSVGGSSTVFGGTLFLDSGSSYTINTKTTGADTYGTLIVGPSTNIRMWNSSAATTTVNSTGSLYSMNNGNVSGALSIWGAYTRSSGSDYWDYATDFDGTVLGSPRQVNVQIASSSSVSISGGLLDIVGIASASTTVANQATGAYTFAVSGGTLNASYYQIRNTDQNGLNLSGSPTISSLSNGDFQLAASTTMITVAGSVISANPSEIWSDDRFATSTGVTGGTNVTLTGTTNSAWTFTAAYGSLAGEAYDNDTGGTCGDIRWDNSVCLLVTEAHYEWRNDDGGEGASGAWYNAAWTDRQAIVVNNPNATSYTNYPVRIAIPYVSPMQSSFADLRFTDSSGTSTIPYFIESTNPSASSTVWVAIPSLPANGSATVYMYYGNASATSTTSNGSNTFPFYEDFETNSIAAYSGDTSLFSTGTSFVHNGTYGLSAGSNFNSKTTNGIYRTGSLLSAASPGETIQYYQYVDATQQDEPCTLFGVHAAAQNYAVCLEEYPSNHVSLSKNVASNDTSGTVLATSSAPYATGWYQVVINWLSSPTNLISVNIYNSVGALFASLSSGDSTYTSGGIGFSYWFQHGGWDFYSAMPYTASAPTYLIDPQQGDNGATWKAAQDTALTGTNGASIGQNIRLRFSIQNTGPSISGQQFELQIAPLNALNCESVTSGYQNVPTATVGCGSSAACLMSSAQFTNNAPTSPSLSFPASMSFSAGSMLQDPGNSSASETASSSLPTNTATEVEYNFQFTSNATGNAYCLRTTKAGSGLDSYTHVAEAVMLHAPTIGTVSFNGGQDIRLTEGTTTTVSASSTVTDLNGYADIVAGTSTFYRSGVAGGASCTANQNNCYQVPSNQCTLSGCSGTQCLMTCSASIEYFADSTDASSTNYSGQSWQATMSAVDSTSLYGSATIAGGVPLDSLLALEVSSPSINFGSLANGGNTGATNATTSIINTGNLPLDVQVSGDPLNGGGGPTGTIPVNSQEFATSTFAYASCALCQALSAPSVPKSIGVNLAQATSTATSTRTQNIYFGIQIPTNVNTGAYTGTNYFTAVLPGS